MLLGSKLGTELGGALGSTLGAALGSTLGTAVVGLGVRGVSVGVLDPTVSALGREDVGDEDSRTDGGLVLGVALGS